MKKREQCYYSSSNEVKLNFPHKNWLSNSIVTYTHLKYLSVGLNQYSFTFKLFSLVVILSDTQRSAICLHEIWSYSHKPTLDFINEF